jgi:hypothetical protein
VAAQQALLREAVLAAVGRSQQARELAVSRELVVWLQQAVLELARVVALQPKASPQLEALVEALRPVAAEQAERQQDAIAQLLPLHPSASFPLRPELRRLLPQPPCLGNVFGPSPRRQYRWNWSASSFL